MRTKTLAILLTVLVVVLEAAPLSAGSWTGTVKLGGVIFDEEGDRSAVQETYNIHEGFSISQLRLVGNPNPDNLLMLDLREINLDGRQGSFLYRRPGLLKVTASFDQHRQVFDPERSKTSDRRDWNLGAQVTPARWISLNGSLNVLTRDGSRLSHPEGTSSALGDRYDNRLLTGRFSVEARKGGKAAALEYRVSDFNDERNVVADRTGQVVSARITAPCVISRKWTHMLRGAYGVSKLSTGDLDYTLGNFQYTGVLAPLDRLRLKYNFEAQRVDHEATGFRTDRFQNNVDATVHHRYGEVSAGYGHETNDNDETLTRYHSWRASTAFRYHDLVSARFGYSGRVKKDEEELTLLKDVEASRFRGDVEVKPIKGFEVGSGFQVREREFPDIDVEAEGWVVNGRTRYTLAGWGGLSGTYAYSEDDYQDLDGTFGTRSNTVTGRVEFERVRNLHLSGGLTFVDVAGDLDIEKTMLSFQGIVDVRKDVHLEAKYNVYDYEDFVLLDRYYNANVVWFNVAYDLNTK